MNLLRDIPDGEVKAMINVMPRLPLDIRGPWLDGIIDRQQNILSGLARVSEYYQDKLRDLDPYLRIRWDYVWKCFIIERVDTGLRAWMPICSWVNTDGSPKRLGPMEIFDILEKLRDSDLRRWDSPEKYLEHKRYKAMKRREENDDKGAQQICDYVQNRMSRQQVDNFIAVERAMVTGEKIRAYGADADWLNKQVERQNTGVGGDMPDPNTPYKRWKRAG